MAAMHQQERGSFLKWLHSNNCRSRTEQEKQWVAKELGRSKERVRIRLKALRYEFRETNTEGISPDKARIIQEWASSNNQGLNPSDHEVEALQQRSGAGSIQSSKWLQKEQRKIFKATQHQHDGQIIPHRKRKRKRTAKGSGYRAALENWVHEHEGRLWQTNEEFTDTLQSLSCSEIEVGGWFEKVELERAFKDPRGFIARNGHAGNEILCEYFSAIHAGVTPPCAGASLVADLLGLPVESIAELIDATREKYDYAYEVETVKNQKRSDSVDSDDGAANERHSGNLPLDPIGTDFTFDGNTDSAVTLTNIEPFPTYVEASSDSSESHSIFPEPFINFGQLLPEAQPSSNSWTLSDIKSAIGRYIQKYHGIVPLSIPFSGEFTLVLSQKMIGFAVFEVLSICQPQRLQSRREVSPEFVFSHAPLPPQHQSLESKIRDCQNRIQYSCPYCDESYNAVSNLAEHLQCHTKPFYVCSVGHCRAHVGEFRMTYNQLYAHLRQHREKEELTDVMKWMPSPKHYWIRQPQVIRSHINSLAKRELLAADVADTEIEEPSPTGADTDRLSNSRNNWYGTLKRQATALSQSDADKTEGISEEMETQVLAYNLQKQRYGRSLMHILLLEANSGAAFLSGIRCDLGTWGGVCVGPRSSLVRVTESCPHNNRVDWTTTKLCLNRGKTCIHFDCRCVSCDQDLHMVQQLRAWGTLSNKEDDDPSCKISGCSYPRLHRAIYCAIHIIGYTVSNTPPSSKAEHRLSVLTQLRGATKWETEAFSGFSPFLDREKLPQSTRFVVIDLEGYLSRKPPVVHQVAMVNINSFTAGYLETVLNVNVSIAHPVPACQTFSTFRENLLQFGKRDYWHYNKEHLSGIRVNLLQAAEMVKESGITPQDYIVVWHRTRADVSALRYLLSQAGFCGVLPPDEHIIRLPYLFRHNLDLPGGVPCSLELLSSAFFPTNSLRFTHHDALIDSKKAALMTLLAGMLCRGEDTRDFQRTTIA